MGPRGINSDGWTGGAGTPPPPGLSNANTSRWLQPMPPLHPPGRKRAPFEWTPRRRAKFHAVLAIFAPFLVALAFAFVKISIRDLWIEAPDLWGWVILAALVGTAFYAMAEFDVLPRLARWMALAWWLLWLAAAVACVVLVPLAHGAATEGPVLRATIQDVHREGKSVVTMLRLQDGTIAATYDGLAQGGNCFAVRRVTGGYGLSWLRIVEALPRPRPGQLEWLVDQAACFSPAPLASLRR